MNWTDFIIAIKQGLIPSKKELVDGTTPVGNALKLNGLTAEEFVSNENLLINADFSNPVNTNGLTEYASGYRWTIDKWFQNYNTYVTVNDGYITVRGDNDIWQTFDEALPSGTYTLSFKARSTDGAHMFAKLGTKPSGECALTSEWAIYTVSATEAVSKITFGMWGTSRGQDLSFDLEWAKLEKGSVATPFIPPNKEVEKLKCLGAEIFVGGISPHFLSKETILDWAVNPNGVYKKFVVASNGYPSDCPVQAEGFYELKIDHSGDRKKVIFYQYGTNDVYTRELFNDEWRSDTWTHGLDGGNSDTVNGITMYKWYTDIDSSFTNQTPIVDLVAKMAEPSKLELTVYAGSNEVYPHMNGVLEIDKTSSGFTSVKFTKRDDGKFWSGVVQGSVFTGWVYSADGGNADTVDGLHASDFLPITGGTVEKATSAPLNIHNTTVDALYSLIAYYANSENLGALGFYGANNPIFYPTDGSGNKALMHEGNYKNFALPLDGSVPMSGDNLFICNKYGLLRADGNQTLMRVYSNPQTSSDFREIAIRSKAYADDAKTALKYTDNVGSAYTTYDVLHTGNSAKVVVSETPLTAEGSIRVW